MSSKAREALAEMVEYAQSAACHCQDAHINHYLSQIIAWGKKALQEPLRNCDVGTAEAQAERFILFCRRNSCRGVCNDSCKFANVNRRLGWQKIGQSRCFDFWAQMPYEPVKTKQTS